jgi:hypothetical protein
MTVTDPAVRSDVGQTICPAGNHELASMLGLDDGAILERIMALSPTHRSALSMVGGIIITRGCGGDAETIKLLPRLHTLILDAHARLATS